MRTGILSVLCSFIGLAVLNGAHRCHHRVTIRVNQAQRLPVCRVSENLTLRIDWKGSHGVKLTAGWRRASPGRTGYNAGNRDDLRSGAVWKEKTVAYMSQQVTSFSLDSHKADLDRNRRGKRPVLKVTVLDSR